ncbi:MAG TPA: hypothetical protein VF594_04515, partial [Rubricoccaceae bacterium]
MTQVGCDDDAGGNNTSLVTALPVTGGTTYYIRVSSFGASTTPGPITLRVTFTPPTPANYTSSTAFQGTGSLFQNQEQFVIRANIVVGGNISGTTTPLTSITFTTTGTTNTADLSRARLIYGGTATTPNLTTMPEFGTAIASPNGTMTFTGSLELPIGSNNLFLVYQATPTATVGNLADATFTSVTVGGTVQAPTTQAPAGSLTIAAPVAANYTSSTGSQTSGTLFQGREQSVLRALVVIGGTTGTTSTTPLTSITFTTTGTTAPTTNLARARVIYGGTATTPDLATMPEFGTAIASPNGTLTFTGSRDLPVGNNNFFLVYQATPTATVGATVDATFTNVTVGGTVRTPTTTAPSGSLTIAAVPANDNLGSARVVGALPYIDTQSSAGATR